MRPVCWDTTIQDRKLVAEQLDHNTTKITDTIRLASARSFTREFPVVSSWIRTHRTRTRQSTTVLMMRSHGRIDSTVLDLNGKPLVKARHLKAIQMVNGPLSEAIPLWWSKPMAAI